MLMLRWIFFACMAAAGESKMIPIASVGEEKLFAIIPKEFYILIIYMLAQALWSLIVYFWKGKNKKEDETSKDLKRIFELLHKLEGRVGELKAAPSEEIILMRLKPYVKAEVLESLMKYKGRDPL